MNTAEKLRFIADRVEDGKEFMINGVKCVYQYGEVHRMTKIGGYVKVSIGEAIESIKEIELAKKPLPKLSYDDFIFLKMAQQCEYGDWWIARDADGTLSLFKEKPTKRNGWWEFVSNPFVEMSVHSSLLNIKWEDEDCYTVNELVDSFVPSLAVGE